MAISQLAETHIIMTKDELRDIIDRHMDEHTKDVWDLVLSSYHGTAEKMAAVLPPAQLAGFELGGKLLERLHLIILEEHPGTTSPDDNEILPE